MLVTWHMTENPNEAMQNPGWKMRWYYFYAADIRHKTATEPSVKILESEVLERFKKLFICKEGDISERSRATH